MDEVWRSHAQTVYRYLLGLTRDAHLAEELTQETFYQAVRCADKYDGSCRITTWLCAIAKNALHSYRRSHPLTAELTETAAVQETPAAALEQGEAHMALLRALHAQLQPAREVLYLRIFGQLSFRQIGEVLDKTENWARVTYYRGKEKLKKELEKDEN